MAGRPNTYRSIHPRFSLPLAAALVALAAVGPGVAGAAEALRVEMTAGSYHFRPDRVVVEKGVPVELVVRSTSYITPHNLVIDSPEAGMEVRVELSRTPVTVRFTPTRTGEHPFYCDNKLLFFESHREKGMAGVIEVVEPADRDAPADGGDTAETDGGKGPQPSGKTP